MSDKYQVIYDELSLAFGDYIADDSCLEVLSNYVNKVASKSEDGEVKITEFDRKYAREALKKISLVLYEDMLEDTLRETYQKMKHITHIEKKKKNIVAETSNFLKSRAENTPNSGIFEDMDLESIPKIGDKEVQEMKKALRESYERQENIKSTNNSNEEDSDFVLDASKFTDDLFYGDMEVDTGTDY